MMPSKRTLTSYTYRWLLPVFILLSSFYFYSCQQTEEGAPPPIEQHELIEIITEALILEPAIRELPKSKKDSLGMQTYERILNQRGYELSAFIESMERLQSQPKRLMTVYETVMEELTKKDAALEGDISDKRRQ